MYKKKIKRGDNEYTYYYTNIRKNGKVRNIFLSSDREEAISLEKGLKANSPSEGSIDPPRVKSFEGSFLRFSLFFGILFLGGLFFYFFNDITGFAVVDHNIIELDVNRDVSLNSTVFLGVGLDEYSKPISDFGLEAVGDNYHINALKVNVNDFNVNLSNGTYTFFLSLVDNGKLVAIKSQDINLLEKDLAKEKINIEEIKVNETKGIISAIINETAEEDTLQENITLPKNVVQKEFNVEDFKESENITFRERITVGKPVKWVRTIKLNQSLSNISIESPREAKNLTVRKIQDNVKTEIEAEKIKVDDLGELKNLEDTNLITGGTIINLGNLLNWLKGITGFAVAETSGDITLQIEDEVQEIEIEFETPGPYSIEIDKDNGKRIEIGSGVEGYTNVLAYAYLDNVDPDDYGRIVVYWVNENTNIAYNYSGTDNGLYVEWNLPHFSFQLFDIYIGQPFSSQNITNAGVYVNTESQHDYRSYTVARSNSTLYCNNLTTYSPVLSYEWYKNDAALGSNTSSLAPGNFVKGDLIFCQINGINSTNRHILDTTLGDFSNGTTAQTNRSTQQGNVTLNWNSNNLRDTLLLMHFDENYTLDTNLTDDVSIYNNNGYCINMTSCPVFNSSRYIGGGFEFDGDSYFNTSSNNNLNF